MQKGNQNEVQPQHWNSLLCLHKRCTNHLLYRVQGYKLYIIHILELYSFWQILLVLETNSVFNLWREWAYIEIRLQSLTLNQQTDTSDKKTSFFCRHVSLVRYQLHMEVIFNHRIKPSVVSRETYIQVRPPNTTELPESSSSHICCK